MMGMGWRLAFLQSHSKAIVLLPISLLHDYGGVYQCYVSSVSAIFMTNMWYVKKKNQQQQNSIQQYTEHAVLKILNIPKNIWLVHTVSLNGIKREISKIEFFYMA